MYVQSHGRAGHPGWEAGARAPGLTSFSPFFLLKGRVKRVGRALTRPLSV